MQAAIAHGGIRERISKRTRGGIRLEIKSKNYKIFQYKTWHVVNFFESKSDAILVFIQKSNILQIFSIRKQTR